MLNRGESEGERWLNVHIAAKRGPITNLRRARLYIGLESITTENVSMWLVWLKKQTCTAKMALATHTTKWHTKDEVTHAK